METIYFIVFCVVNAVIIFWSLRYDDQADFHGQKRDKKFVPAKKKSAKPQHLDK